MKKLCLVFSACAALAFSGTVNAQSVGEIIQSTTGDYKAYKVVSGNLFENGSFEGGTADGTPIEGWYGGTNQPAVVGGSTAFKILAEGYKGQCLEFKAAGSGDPTSLRTWVQVKSGKSYYFNGYAKGTVATESWKWSYICECSSWGGVSEGASSYRFNVNNNSTWVQKTKIFENVQNNYIVVKFANTGNRIKIDEFTLVEIEEAPNIPLLKQTIADVDAELGGRDNADDVIKVRLKNAEALSENVDATIEEVYNTIIDLEKIDVSFNNTLKAFREQLAIAEELGVDVETYNQKLLENASTITASEINGTLSNDLNVDEFNAVKKLYTCNYPLGEWVKENVVETHGEHWSGSDAYYMYNYIASGVSNTKLVVKQTVTLPAGEYVLKAAGYTNVSAVSPFMMSVKDKSVVFPQKGRTGYGIDVSGNANFSPEGEYANSGDGRGWEWRFIPFKLENTETLEFYFEAELKGNSWAGLGDIQLLGKAYYRDVTSGDYGTICLPYEVDMTSVSGVEKVYTVSSMTNDLATLTPVEAMEAGKPYIFKSNADEVVMPAKVGGTVVGTPQKDTYLVGTFSDIEALTDGTYVLSGNKFYYVNSPVRCAAYRCYFNALSSGVKNFGFVEDGDETTGIDKIESEVGMKNAVIYDLTGRRVTSPVKGIYIVNGKKMVVDNLK